MTLTENSVSDDVVVEALAEQIEQEVAKSAADGAYDKRKVYDGLNAHSPKADILIPPRKNARIWKHGNTKAQRLKRDENLRSIRRHGRKEWKKKSGYHVRSPAETTTLAPALRLMQCRCVSPENDLRQRTLRSFAENTNHTGIRPLRCSQPDDALGYAAKLQSRLTISNGWITPLFRFAHQSQIKM